MKKTVSGLSFFFAFVLALQNAYSFSKGFEYVEEFDEEKGEGLIAVQHFKNAPYPSFQIPFGEEGFTPAAGTLEIEGKTHATRFFGGWLFIDLKKEHLSSSPLIVNTLKEYGKNDEIPLLQSIMKASCELLEACEKQNLQNPYAGRSLTANYFTQVGIPVVEQLVPTATCLESGAIRLVRSLAAVYGGTLEKANPEGFTLHFKNGDHSVFSYGDKMISANSMASYLKGDFRRSDDGKTANKSLRITNLESWFNASQNNQSVQGLEPLALTLALNAH